MTRVLLLIKGLGRGGAERLLVDAIRYGDHSRFEYEVAYLLPVKSALVPELAAMGVTVHCLDGAHNLRWMSRLRRLVRERRIDVVHVHSPYPATVARLGLPPDVPIVYTEHNQWERYRAPTYWGNALTFPRNRRVFAVSDHVRESAAYPWPLRFIEMPPMETLYHGLDPAAILEPMALDGVRAEFGIPTSAPLVGTVANFKDHKGYPYLLEAARMLRRSIPDVRFLLVGVGPGLEDRKQQSRTLGLDDCVVFTGFREDARRLMAAMDVFVLASLQEGLSIALIEAMALGRPTVVTRVGGLPEVVEDGVEGLVVPPEDSQALAQAIWALLADESRRRHMGERARRRAVEFDIRKAVRRIEQVYDDLVSEATAKV